MNRRHFFQTFLGATLVPWAAQAWPRPATRRIPLQGSPIAGLQYHQGEAVWSWLREGHPLQLIREPHNRHDPHAVAVYWEYDPAIAGPGGQPLIPDMAADTFGSEIRRTPRGALLFKLGYLPRIENIAVSQMLDRGERLGASIVRVKESRHPGERVRLKIWLVT